QAEAGVGRPADAELVARGRDRQLDRVEEEARAGGRTFAVASGRQDREGEGGGGGERDERRGGQDGAGAAGLAAAGACGGAGARGPEEQAAGAEHPEEGKRHGATGSMREATKRNALCRASPSRSPARSAQRRTSPPLSRFSSSQRTPA